MAASEWRAAPSDWGEPGWGGEDALLEADALVRALLAEHQYVSTALRAHGFDIVKVQRALIQLLSDAVGDDVVPSGINREDPAVLGEWFSKVMYVASVGVLYGLQLGQRGLG